MISDLYLKAHEHIGGQLPEQGPKKPHRLKTRVSLGSDVWEPGQVIGLGEKDAALLVSQGCAVEVGEDGEDVCPKCTGYFPCSFECFSKSAPKGVYSEEKLRAEYARVVSMGELHQRKEEQAKQKEIRAAVALAKSKVAEEAPETPAPPAGGSGNAPDGEKPSTAGEDEKTSQEATLGQGGGSPPAAAGDSVAPPGKRKPRVD